jgi:hypothetical protein
MGNEIHHQLKTGLEHQLKCLTSVTYEEGIYMGLPAISTRSI